MTKKYMHKLLSTKKITNSPFNTYPCSFNNIKQKKKKNIEKFKYQYLNVSKNLIIFKNYKLPSVKKYLPVGKKILITLFYFFLITFFSKFQTFSIDIYEFKNKFSLNRNYAFINNVVEESFFKIDILSLGLLSCVNSKIILQFFLTQINSLREDIKENGVKGKIKLENLNKLIVIVITFIGSIFYFTFIWQLFDHVNNNAFLLFISNFLVGSLFILWVIVIIFQISEKINDLKIGPGLSILILYNLMLSLENKLSGIKIENSSFLTIAYALISFMLILFAFGLILIQDSEKKLKIKYLQTKIKSNISKSTQYTKKNKFSFIPVKANPSNVLSFILAFFLLQENFNEYFGIFFNKYHIFNKSLILALKNILICLIITIFNTVFGIQQINLSDLVKNIRNQNISVLGVGDAKNLKKYITNCVLCNSVLSSIILISLFNLEKFFESYSNLKIIQGLTSNVIIIVSGITIDIVKRIYIEISYISYATIKL